MYNHVSNPGLWLALDGLVRGGALIAFLGIVYLGAKEAIGFHREGMARIAADEASRKGPSLDGTRQH